MTPHSHFHRQSLVLRGGAPLHVRPQQPEDEPRVRRFFDQLTARTRYLRFLSYAPGAPEAFARQLAAIDDAKRLTLLAEVNQEPGSEVVGIGNLVTIDDRQAEAALVVTDAWQHRGIGLALARRLLEAGERLGVSRFVAHTLWNNLALRAVLARTADVIRTEIDGSIVKITFVPSRHPDLGFAPEPHGR